MLVQMLMLMLSVLLLLLLLLLLVMVLMVLMVLLSLLLVERGACLVQRTVGGAYLQHWIRLVNCWRRMHGQGGHGRGVGMVSNVTYATGEAVT